MGKSKILQVVEAITKARARAMNTEQVAVYIQREFFDDMQTEVWFGQKTSLDPRATLDGAAIFIVSSSWHPPFRAVTYKDDDADTPLDNQ